MSDILVWKHIKLTDSVAREMGLDPAIVGDLGLETLFKAAESFHSDETNFAMYARKHLKWRYNDYRKANPAVVNLEDQVYDLAEETGQKADSFVITDRDIADFHESLTQDELELVRAYYLEKKSLQQIANDYAVVRQTIADRLKKIKGKL